MDVVRHLCAWHFTNGLLLPQFSPKEDFFVEVFKFLRIETKSFLHLR